MSKKNRNKAQVQQTTTEEHPIDIEETSDIINTDEVVEELDVQENTSEDVTVGEESDVVLEEEFEDNMTEEVEDFTEQESEESLSAVVAESTEPKTPIVEKKVVNNTQGVLKVEKKSAPANSSVMIPQTPNVLKLKELTDAYITLMTGPKTDETRRRACITLMNIANFVGGSSETAVFDSYYAFVLKNKNIMLTPEIATAGITQYVDKTKIAKILQFYVAFQSLVESKLLGSKFTLNVTTIRRLFNNDALANWFITKR